MSFIAEYELDNPIVAEAREILDGPEFVVEDEHVAPGGAKQLVIWAHGDPADLADVDDALALDSTVDEWEQLADLGGSQLYRIDLTESGTVGMTYPKAMELGITFLDIRTAGDMVRYRAQVPSREAFARYRELCDGRDIDFRLVSLYRGDPDDGDGYGTTERQREVLTAALEAGYFDVPRETSLEELADELDVSGQALSALLRRGQANLLRNTIGREPGDDSA